MIRSDESFEEVQDIMKEVLGDEVLGHVSQVIAVPHWMVLALKPAQVNPKLKSMVILLLLKPVK